MSNDLTWNLCLFGQPGAASRQTEVANVKSSALTCGGGNVMAEGS